MYQRITRPSLGAGYTPVLPGYCSVHVERHAACYQGHELEVLIARVLHQDIGASVLLSPTNSCTRKNHALRCSAVTKRYASQASGIEGYQCVHR